VAGVAIAAAVVMGRSLAAKSLWIDETLSLKYAHQSLRDLFPFFVHGEMNMALYHVLLHFWLRLGEGEAAVRSLSVLFAVAAIPFGYAICARLFSRRTGALAATLLALNGAYYSYAREARSYSLVVFLVIAASYFLVEATITGERFWWGAYTAAATLAVYAHFFAFFVLGAHLLSVFFGWRRRIERRRVVVTSAVVLVLSIPAAVYIAKGNTELTTDPNVSLHDVPDLFRWYATGNRPLLAVYTLGILAAAATGISRLYRGHAREAWPQLFLFTWLLVPIVGALAVSYAIDPMFQPRYLLVALPPFVFLVAYGLSAARPLALFALVVAVATVASYRSLSLCEPGCVTPTQDFRDAAAFIRARALPGDQILFDPPYLRTAFAYYARQPRGGRAGETPLDQGDHVAPARRVWLLSDTGDPNLHKYTPFTSTLLRRDQQVSTRDFPNLLRVSLYVRRALSTRP
jgi:mannosyltransferase